MSWWRDMMEALTPEPIGRPVPPIVLKPLGANPPAVPPHPWPPPPPPPPIRKAAPSITVQFTATEAAKLGNELDQLIGKMKALEVEMKSLSSASVRRRRAERFREAGW